MTLCRESLWGAVPFGWERDPYVADLHTRALACALGMSQADAAEYGLQARRQAEARVGRGPALHRAPGNPQGPEVGA